VSSKVPKANAIPKGVTGNLVGMRARQANRPIPIARKAFSRPISLGRTSSAGPGLKTNLLKSKSRLGSIKTGMQVGARKFGRSLSKGAAKVGHAPGNLLKKVGL